MTCEEVESVLAVAIQSLQSQLMDHQDVIDAMIEAASKAADYTVALEKRVTALEAAPKRAIAEVEHDA